MLCPSHPTLCRRPLVEIGQRLGHAHDRYVGADDEDFHTTVLATRFGRVVAGDRLMHAEARCAQPFAVDFNIAQRLRYGERPSRAQMPV